MIKHYLIPAEITIENGEPSRNPKYLDTLKVNWSGVYVESKDVYVVVVNESKDLNKLTELENKLDIITLDNTKKSKDDASLKLGLPKIKDEDNDVEAIAKLQVPDFTKDKIWVKGNE